MYSLIFLPEMSFPHLYWFSGPGVPPHEGMVSEVPTPPLKGQAQTPIPCYVSELSSVPNQHQPDLLLIDLISSYRERGQG